MENYLESIADLLEVESVALTDSFESFDVWDSLTILSIIAYCDSDFDVQFSSDEIEAAETVQGLKDLIESRR
ncbi:phosphopantetheine-binding protein [Formosa sp. 3Alg 14/1]|uniref:phosphopantetheine-binding protein n=1 Tax=Formosa sp. 3Alg 14/1 TaxID=3382190 RepID=UPI0039BE53FC